MLTGKLLLLYKDLCCEWVCWLWVKALRGLGVRVFNTGYLFLFVPIPGGLLLGLEGACVGVRV